MATTVKIITKAQVIKALRTEPLEAQAFFHSEYATLERCNVCAVGAVMRQTSCLKWAQENGLRPVRIAQMLTNDQYKTNHPVRQIKEGNYFGGLSSFFEKYYTKKREKDGVRAARAMMVEFVKKHFPAAVEVRLSKNEVFGLGLVVVEKLEGL
jgi:hypothetical protein